MPCGEKMELTDGKSHNILVTEVALQVDIDITQSWDGNIVLLVLKSRVHIVTELVVVSKVSGIECLSHCGAPPSSAERQPRDAYIFYSSFSLSFMCVIILLLLSVIN